MDVTIRSALSLQLIPMRGADHKQSPLFCYVNLEDRIPRDHPLRRVKVLADLVLRSMSAHFDALYAEGGRPSVRRNGAAGLAAAMPVFDPLGTRACRTYRFQHDVPRFVGLTLDGDLGSLDVYENASACSSVCNRRAGARGDPDLQRHIIGNR